MSESLLPPIYSQVDPDDASVSQPEPIIGGAPQILIIPSGDAVNFQKGFLGAEGEHAAIEGELQIKAAVPDQWAKVSISLRTVERVDEHEIELNTSENVLYTRTHDVVTPFPTSLPFAIPLQADAPQSIRTSNSALAYILTATLHPFDPLSSPHFKTLTVHTRRYTSHSYAVPVHPETYSLEQPTRVEVQVPRITFVAGESIPVYVTIPPPAKELVVDQGLRLRNVRAELVRDVKVQTEDLDGVNDEPFLSETPESSGVQMDGPSSTAEESPQSMSSKAPLPPMQARFSHKTTIARSGASCRFHSSRPVKLRFVLHHLLFPGSPLSFPSDLPGPEYGPYNSDEECPSITQVTILHSIIFSLCIHISFVDITNRTEQISSLFIPIIILAQPAPLPQVSREIDAAYSKKHDKPPLRTVRNDDIEYPIPHYSEGEAGPSMHPNSAPPPFEERDAPPPFSLDDIRGSSTSRLPTFLESEEEIIIPGQSSLPTNHPPPEPRIVGEGLEFGFLPSDQFDGHTEPIQRSITPPPSLEMATRDTDLTDLADIREPEMAVEALGLALDRHGESLAGERPPPPPPAMDDPSDPPPSIDSDFRSPEVQTPPPHTTSSQHPTFTSNDTPTPREPAQIHGFAPPPYLVPANTNDQENIARPPPYMD